MDDDYYYGSFTDDYSDNYTDVPNCCSSTHHGLNTFLPVMYYLIFFTGFWGNLLVISVVGSKGKRGGRLVDTFVVNLALADLIFVTTLPLWAISASQNAWNFGSASDLLCKLSSYVISVNRFSSIFFLTCMSIDRYLAIVKMMDSRYLRSSQCIRITCAALWIASLVLGIPSLVYRKVVSNDGEQVCREDTKSVFFLSINLVIVLLTFIFPVFVIALCYRSIIKHLNRHCVASGNPRTEARRKHSLKMVLCIIVAFVVSWLPYNTFKSTTTIFGLVEIDLSSNTEIWLQNGILISSCLAFFNSCVNPAIYFFLDHHFRRQAKVLYKNCTGKSKVLQSFNSSVSFTNAGTSESYATSGGRSQLQMSP